MKPLQFDARLDRWFRTGGQLRRRNRSDVNAIGNAFLIGNGRTFVDAFIHFYVFVDGLCFLRVVSS